MKIVLILTITLAAMTVAAKHPDQNLARVREIAAHLPALAATVGPTPDNREVWAPLAAEEGAKKIIAQAAKWAGKPLPEAPDSLYLEFAKVDGNRSRYERVFFDRRQRLDVFMLAEALEWKGRFLKDISRCLETVLAEKAWTVPAHDPKLDCFEGRRNIVALYSSQRCWTVAYAIKWFGDLLAPALVERARAECRRRVLGPYLETCRAPGSMSAKSVWWFFGRNNWTAVCHLNCTASALMLLDDRQERAECLEACERAMPYFLSGFTADGYCSEGMGYWGYGFGCYTSLALISRHYTGDYVKLLSDSPKAACVARYANGFQLEEGLSPRFADGGGNASRFALAEAARLWPEAVDEKHIELPLFEGSMSNFGKWPHCCAVDRRAFGFKALEGKPIKGALPQRTIFPDAQVFLMRPAAKGGIAVAFKGGHNDEFHNHNDVGTYAASVNGVYLLGDVGGEVYTARTFSRRRYESNVINSFGHAVPRIDGALQPRGAKFAAKVLHTEFTDARDVVKLDLKGAYECAKLLKLERTLTYDRIKGAFTLCDEIEFSEPAALDMPFVTSAACRREGDKWVLGDNSAAIEVAVKVEGGAWDWATDELDNGRKLKVMPSRHSITFSAPVKSAKVEYSFKAL